LHTKNFISDIMVQVTNHQKFRVTMAAIDPGPTPFYPNSGGPIDRATLKLLREPIDDDDESDEDYDDVDAIRARLAGAISDEEDEDEEDEDSDEEKNGGPSDPDKTP
jgi:FK506-binding nuclear protein